MFGSDLLAPSFLFAVGFAACGIMLLLFNYWNYKLHIGTALVLLLGVTSFGVASLIVQDISKRSRGSGFSNHQKVCSVPVRRGVLISAFCVQIVVGLVSVAVIAERYPSASIALSIDAYGSAVKFTNADTSLGIIIDNARLACVMWAYLACYLTAQELQAKKWGKSVLAATNVLGGAIIQLETGGRQGAFTFLLVTVFCYLLLRRKTQLKRIDIRWILVLVLGVAGLTVVFRYSAIGRDVSEFDFLEYLVVYCGAQFANLDIYLNSHQWFTPETPGWMTFSDSLSWLAKHTGFTTSDLSVSPFIQLPFESAGGRSLGNVYTCFYNYHIDFGILGVVMCSIIMALVSQLIYQRARDDFGESHDLWVTMYAFVAVQLLMSFFANKFFSEFFTLSLLKGAIFFLVFRFAYMRFGLRSKMKPSKTGKTASVGFG